MQAGCFKSSIGIILVVAAIAGCGSSDSPTNDVKSTSAGTSQAKPASSEASHVKPGSNVPKGGAVETAKVLEKVQKGIPAQRGQWMVDIGVDPGGDLAYTVAKVIAPPGNTNFRFENPQAEGHNLTIEEVGAGHAETPIVSEGSRWIRVSLFEGKKFVFYCSVPGHREAGMEGILEVDPSLTAADLKPF